MAVLLLASIPLHAQQAATPAPAGGPVSPGAANAASTLTGEQIVTLSPFDVVSERDDGFMATNAGTATKLGLDMKDMAAPYSVMTGEFIKAMGITDLQSAVMWSTNGAPVLDGQGADLFGGGGTSTASTMYNVRGAVINAGQQRNFFLTAAIGDTYNIERIDFGRGPNAVLFNVGANDALGGGISTQGKRPRVDRDTNTVGLTVGSWDYYRGTLDINRVLIPDKLAVRANVLHQERKGWMDQEFDDRTGVTLSALYRFGRKTELQIETIADKVRRSRVPLPYFENFSGWNGITVFDGPITNDQLNGLAPLANGTFLARGATSPTNPAIVAYSGQPEGVWRENGNLYVYNPATNSVMNWIHTGSTRRGDETPLTPVYIDGVAWTRGNNGELLPLGNYGASGGNSRTPGVTSNGGSAAFLDMINLPGGLLSRQIAASNMEGVPSRRFSAMPNEPLFRQPHNDVNFALRHQAGEDLYFELAGDKNRVIEQPLASYLGLRTAFIDLNQTLPNGQANPNFLDPYSQVDMVYNHRRMENYGLKANVAWIKDLGKWGHYTFNLSGSLSGRRIHYTRYTLSLASADDPREWQAGGQRIRVRYYWNDTDRPWSDVNPTTLFNRVPSADGNSYTATTTTIDPRWVLFEWSDRKEKTRSLILAAAARWFDNKLVVSPGVRIDRQSTHLRNMPASWGFMPNDPNWDGVTLDDRYWRQDAPADWLNLTYTPRNADGSPSSSQPLPAITRPTIAGPNGVNIANPLYANDRFRNDYSNPRVEQTIVMKNVGATYHIFNWLSLKANYGEGYKPLDPARFYIDGTDAEPEKGVAYEGGLTFSLFNDRLAITPRYYYNEKLNRLGDPPTTSPFNALMGRRAWNDPGLEGRNPLGYSNVLGGDYFSTKNDGVEVEINGRITRGWRVLANFGTGQLVDYGRWKNTRAYIEGRQSEMLEVLRAAGGALDTTARPFNAGRAIEAAPGLAIADPNITDTMITAAGGSTAVRTNAVNDYNNIWVQYDNIGLLADTIGIKRMSMKVFTDYTVQSGRFKGVRFGLGWQYVDKDIAGYRSGDTIANPNFNASLPVSATNRPWMDDPDVDLNTPVWIKRPSEWTGTIGYSRRLRSRISFFENTELEIQLTIRNLTNKQAIYYQDDGVTLRPPDGDFNAPNRVAVPGRVAAYQRPINFELTTTLKF